MVIDILDLLDLMDPITTFGVGLRKTSETAVFILVTLFLAVAHISYLPIADDCTCIYVIIQLVVASLITYFLDKILSHFRICSTLTIFILKSACATVIKEGLSLSTTDYGQGAQLDGSLVFLLQSLSTFKSKSLALYRAFFRKDSNLTTFGSTVVVFLTITFLQGVRVDLPVKSKNLFGQHGTFPIKLFYTSHTSFVTQVLLASHSSTNGVVLYYYSDNRCLASGVFHHAGLLREMALVSRYLGSPRSKSDPSLGCMLLSHTTLAKHDEGRSNPHGRISHSHSNFLHNFILAQHEKL